VRCYLGVEKCVRWEGGVGIRFLWAVVRQCHLYLKSAEILKSTKHSKLPSLESYCD